MGVGIWRRERGGALGLAHGVWVQRRERIEGKLGFRSLSRKKKREPFLEDEERNFEGKKNNNKQRGMRTRRSEKIRFLWGPVL